MELYTPLILCAGAFACTMQSLLQSKDYRVIAVDDIEKAQGVVDGESPDLLLLDTAMSSSEEFCVSLQKREKTIPVVLLADSEKQRKQACFETVVECLEKPIQPLVLVEKVELLLKNCVSEQGKDAVAEEILQRENSQEIAKRNAAILAKLKVLQKSYALQLPEKSEQLEHDWKSLREIWDTDRLESLERMVHSLTGSGKTYGFADISTTARKFEWWLKVFLTEGTKPDRPGFKHGDELCDSLSKALNEAYHSVP